MNNGMGKMLDYAMEKVNNEKKNDALEYWLVVYCLASDNCALTKIISNSK